MSCSVRETSVARDERCFERFSESNVDGVIGGEIVPQFPHARQQHIMGVAVQGKNREVGEGRAALFAVDLPIRRITADHLRDFDIEQMRRVQRLLRIEQASFHCLRRRRAQQHFENG